FCFMKTLRIILLLFAVSPAAMAQDACCSASSPASFAMLGDNHKFIKAHADPLTFHYKPETGKMISVPADDGKPASIFEVKNSKPTANYLILVHEWWGLNDYIMREAESLQKDIGNINVLAVDLYDGKTAPNAEEAGKLMKQAKEERIRSILKAAI